MRPKLLIACAAVVVLGLGLGWVLRARFERQAFEGELARFADLADWQPVPLSPVAEHLEPELRAALVRARARQGGDTLRAKLAGWVDDIEGRMVDLLIPFRSFAVYHPDQHGSASMKGILPALTGMDYGDLDIAEGMVASSEYFRVTHTDAPEEEREEVYRQLREYCDLDTAGMVKIVERLRELVDD